MINDDYKREGPYRSLDELKKRSKIFKSQKSQRNKERILKATNIVEVSGFIIERRGKSHSLEFMKALNHVMVGRISRSKVKGVHFYHPDRCRILEIVTKNDLGVYRARIETMNKYTGKWIEKEEITSFFPDHWSINKLFHECSFAYNNRKHVDGRVYVAESMSGVRIKIIIDEHGRILTMYPEV